MRKEENLMKCEAYREGICLFGCDAIADNYFKSEEALEKNYFDYYHTKKSCEALERIRRRNK